MFDTEEYVHLALHARTKGEVHAALHYLHEAQRLEPENVSVIMLLGWQHAELGMIDRGIREMERGLKIDPRMEYARFQLGTLLLDRRRHSEASEQFHRLKGSEDPALRSYADAMLALTESDPAAARAKLAVGLAQRQMNPMLAQSMKALFESLAKGSGEAKTAAETPEVADTSPGFLGAYRKTAG
jgi:tetratricopeptide (TPR) repeat protein